ETILPRLADSLHEVLRQRHQTADQVERMLDPHPLARVLTSMPGIGVRIGAPILLDVGDATAFPTPGHLAAYAGLAPVTRRSGSASAATTRPRAATSNSNARSSSPRSPPSRIHPPAPTTTANAPRERNTTPP